MSYDKCTEVTTNPIIKLVDSKGGKSKFLIKNNNRKEVYKTTVDGCLITGHERKCDFLVRLDDPNEVHLVELKGKGLDRAISQLESTLRNLPDCVKKHKKNCYAVTSVVPKGGPGNMLRKKSSNLRITLLYL